LHRKAGNAPRMTDAILLERLPFAGKPLRRIVCRLAAINENRSGNTVAQEVFWHGARAQLSRLHRLTLRDRDAIETLLAERVPKPA
jgi:hypothetical protein